MARRRRYWLKPGGKYIRKAYHKKKFLSEKEAVKKEWRRYKGIDRDNAKSYNAWCNRGACGWIKRHCNKMHRAWEKDMMSHGRYDEMSEVDYKYFLDPWYWD